MNDPVDEPFAQRIQHELTARGGQKVDAADASTRIVLVLSNRTHLAWLDALETELRDKDLVTVVVTAIGVSPTLNWLWKRQWIDFRRCASADDSKRQSTLPVPEALDRARLPLLPAFAHHLLCSIAGLGFVAANIVAETQHSDIDTLGLLTDMSTALLLWLAWKFAGRRISQLRFNSWVAVVWSTLTLLCFAQFVRYFEIKGLSFLGSFPQQSSWPWRRSLQPAGDLASDSGFQLPPSDAASASNCLPHPAVGGRFYYSSSTEVAGCGS